MNMLTAAEVATLLKLSQRKVYELAASRKLASHRFGGSVRFAHEDVQAYVESCRVPARPEARGVQLSIGTRNMTPELRRLGREFVESARKASIRVKPTNS